MGHLPPVDSRVGLTDSVERFFANSWLVLYVCFYCICIFSPQLWQASKKVLLQMQFICRQQPHGIWLWEITTPERIEHIITCRQNQRGCRVSLLRLFIIFASPPDDRHAAGHPCQSCHYSAMPLPEGLAHTAGFSRKYVVAWASFIICCAVVAPDLPSRV